MTRPHGATTPTRLRIDSGPRLSYPRAAMPGPVPPGTGE